jgi:hypothetical protein
MFSLKYDEGCESLANIILPAIHERETLKLSNTQNMRQSKALFREQVGTIKKEKSNKKSRI